MLFLIVILIGAVAATHHYRAELRLLGGIAIAFAVVVGKHWQTVVKIRTAWLYGRR